MPAMSGKFDSKFGPIVPIIIRSPSVDGSESKKTTSEGRFQALIDTGASQTCIAPSVVSSLNLSPIGRRTMYSASGSNIANLYFADIIFAFGSVAILRPKLQLMEFAQPSAPFQVLLGMDIIGTGVLVLSNDGHFSLAL